MDKYDIDLSPSTLEKLEDLALKLNISCEEVLEKIVKCYCNYQHAYAQGKKILVVFDRPNFSIENLINKFWDSEFT